MQHMHSAEHAVKTYELPQWYLRLLQICVPRASHAHRRQTEATTARVTALMHRFLQQVQDGNLSLDELTAMEIGLGSVRDQLPEYVVEDEKFTRSITVSGATAAAAANEFSNKRRANLSPCLSSCKNPQEPILKNGSHCLSLIDLKSLERELKVKEKRIVVNVCKDFREGFLHEEVVNSYLTVLCEEDQSCVYVPVSTLRSMAKGIEFNEEMWLTREQLQKRRYIFLPWMPDDSQPMVLLIVDIEYKRLVYLNPLHQIVVEKNLEVEKAREFVEILIKPRFSFEIHSIVTLDYTDLPLHQTHDLPARVRNGQKGGFISVLVCMYARWYVETLQGFFVTIPTNSDISVFRAAVYDTVVGSCLEGTGSREHCKKCTSTNDGRNMIRCSRCRQQFHVDCLTLDMIDDMFKCPSSEHNGAPVNEPVIGAQLTEWTEEVPLTHYTTE